MPRKKQARVWYEFNLIDEDEAETAIKALSDEEWAEYAYDPLVAIRVKRPKIMAGAETLQDLAHKLENMGVRSNSCFHALSRDHIMRDLKKLRRKRGK